MNSDAIIRADTSDVFIAALAGRSARQRLQHLAQGGRLTGACMYLIGSPKRIALSTTPQGAR